MTSRTTVSCAAARSLCQMPVVAGPAHTGQTAQPLDRPAALRHGHRLDDFADRRRARHADQLLSCLHMPQGLPKKIEIGLLLAYLALELGDPTPGSFAFIEDRALQGRPIQGALCAGGRDHAALPVRLGVPVPAIRTADGGRSPDPPPLPTPPRPSTPDDRCRFTSARHHNGSFHQFLSFRETVRRLTVSLSGCTPKPTRLMLWTAPTLRHRSAVGWLR